jgi:transcriptional regulator with GAF, ATPase, and Fis domain
MEASPPALKLARQRAAEAEVRYALEAEGDNRAHAAKRLGISYTWLKVLMRRFGISRRFHVETGK